MVLYDSISTNHGKAVSLLHYFEEEDLESWHSKVLIHRTLDGRHGISDILDLTTLFIGLPHTDTALRKSQWRCISSDALPVCLLISHLGFRLDACTVISPAASNFAFPSLAARIMR